MSSYAKINGWVRGVSESLFPSVLFLAATWDEMSQDSAKTTESLIIGLNQGYQISRPSPDSNSESAQLVIDIGVMDQLDSDSIQQMNLLTTCDVFAEKMITALVSTGVAASIQISGIKKIPFYKKWAPLISGVALVIEVQSAGCGDYTYADMTKYMKDIGRDINPIDWQGTLPR